MKEKYIKIASYVNVALICFIVLVAGIIAYPESLFFRNLVTLYGFLIMANIVIILIINIKPKKDEK